LTGEKRLANAKAETTLGDDALRAAEELLKLGLPNDAVSRAYYAAFHYARALLLLEGLEPKTHRGVVTLLSEHFEATKRLSSDAVSAALARVQTFRDIADYDARNRVSRERAELEVKSAEQFVKEARAVLRAAGAFD
jgi:uncharacterized protein (UPF0332 family)